MATKLTKIKGINHIDFRTEKRVSRLNEVLSKRQPTLTVILENINDPHNLSACLRSCDATGIMEVNLLYHGTQKEPKISATSSATAKKWVKINKFYSVEECYAEMRRQGKKIYTTMLTANSKSIYELDLTQPVALVFGNEHAGVSQQAVDSADGNFLMPQVGMIESLNISVAVAVSVYEAFRQRYVAGMYDRPQLDEAAYAAKMKEWAAM